MSLPTSLEEHSAVAAVSRYRPYTLAGLRQSSYWSLLGAGLREELDIVSRVLPFRVNEHVLSELIDWDQVPEDPIFQMVFPQRGMLTEDAYERVRAILDAALDHHRLEAEVQTIRSRLNPHPAGQVEDNVPRLDGRRLEGIQHKYAESVLFFPAPGQVCHAYCTYCFRWPQFVRGAAPRFQAPGADDLLAYFEAHPEVTDVILTGGDPLAMTTRVLRRFVEPLLDEAPEHVQTIRIGTKAITYWPQRFTTDDDADDLLRLFEQVAARGHQLALMAHIAHPQELRSPICERAVERIRSTGALIRTQAPLLRHINDCGDTWAELWRTEARLGMVPYYLFVERDTGPRHYFEVPLAAAHRIFRDAYAQVSGIARTVRGPSMSAHPGKVRLLGEVTVEGTRCFVLDYLQARDQERVRRPFLARYDERATWFDQLEPAFESEREFFPERPLGRPTGAAEGRST